MDIKSFKPVSILLAVIVMLSVAPGSYGIGTQPERINDAPGVVRSAVLDNDNVFYTTWDNSAKKGNLYLYDLKSKTRTAIAGTDGYGIGFTGYYQGLASNGFCAFTMYDTVNKPKFPDLYGYSPESSTIRKINIGNANVQNWSVWDRYVFMPTYGIDKPGIYMADITKDEPPVLVCPFTGKFDFCMSKAGDGYFVFERRDYDGAGPKPSDNFSDVCMYEIATGKTIIIDDSSGEQGCPIIQNGFVYYVDFIDGRSLWNYKGAKIMAFEIATGIKRVVITLGTGEKPYLYMNPKSSLLGLIMGSDTGATKVATIDPETGTIVEASSYQADILNVLQFGSLYGKKILWQEFAGSTTASLKTGVLNEDSSGFDINAPIIANSDTYIKSYGHNSQWVMYLTGGNIYVEKVMQ